MAVQRSWAVLGALFLQRYFVLVAFFATVPIAAFVVVDTTSTTTSSSSRTQHRPQNILNHRTTSPQSLTTTTVLQASLASRHYTRKQGGGGGGRDGGRRNNGPDRTKRQERVGQLVQTELSRIIHTGIIRGDVDYLEGSLRKRISVVSADVSPDLKQARISISVRGRPETTSRVKHSTGDIDDETEAEEETMATHDNPVVDKRRAYAWLVRNTKPIRHTLAQKMSHMKSSPSLTFVQVDVAAATDVMYLIDKVAAGYKRERIGSFGINDMPTGILSGIDFDEDFDDDDEWDEDEDNNFFSN